MLSSADLTLQESSLLGFDSDDDELAALDPFKAATMTAAADIEFDPTASASASARSRSRFSRQRRHEERNKFFESLLNAPEEEEWAADVRYVRASFAIYIRPSAIGPWKWEESDRDQVLRFSIIFFFDGSNSTLTERQANERAAVTYCASAEFPADFQP